MPYTSPPLEANCLPPAACRLPPSVSYTIYLSIRHIREGRDLPSLHLARCLVVLPKRLLVVATFADVTVVVVLAPPLPLAPLAPLPLLPWRFSEFVARPFLPVVPVLDLLFAVILKILQGKFTEV